MRISALLTSPSLLVCFFAIMATLPAQAAIDAVKDTGATGMDTYYIDTNDTGRPWRAIDNLGGWLSGSNNPFTESRRDVNTLELTSIKEGVVRFDFLSGDILKINSSSGPIKIGVMKRAHQLSPAMVNSFTYLSQSNGDWIETAWDQIYLEKDEGQPSGWAREISVSTRRPSVTSKSNFLTSGNIENIRRVAGHCSLACNF